MKTLVTRSVGHLLCKLEQFKTLFEIIRGLPPQTSENLLRYPLDLEVPQDEREGHTIFMFLCWIFHWIFLRIRPVAFQCLGRIPW